jgi:CelD/BcsL family acetyltransferase involved in cellulose biosynthesis
MHAPLRQATRVEWHGLSTLGSIAEEWRALAARALEPNVFYEPEFMLAAAPVFGTDAGAALVRAATGRLLGLFPARVESRRGPFARVVGWTHPFAPLGTPLVDRDHPEDVIAAWLAQFSGDLAGPALMLMPLLPEHGAFATALNTVLERNDYAHAAFGRHRRALLEPGAQRAGYLERSISTNRRKELRRQRRRLEQIGPVKLASVASPRDIEAALRDFLVIEASGWKGLAGTAAVSDPAVHEFFESAVMTLAAEGRARIDRLCLDGRAIAAAITLRSADTAWLWKIAYSEGVARYSPGVQLIHDVTESLLTDPELRCVDSCATSDHPMIDHIWRERLELADRLIALRPSALPFAFVRGLESMQRSAIAAVKAVRDRIRR